MQRDIEDIYTLSPMQQGMLFHALLAPESGAYVEQTSAILAGALHADAFVQAWQRMVDRHTILRTSFVWEDVEEPVQVVQRKVMLPCERLDWREMETDEQERRLLTLRQSERARGFDLAVAPLLRLTLVQLADERWGFVLTHHHLLLDGWSLPILMSEVFAAYEALSRGKPVVLPPRRPFRDYIAWLKKRDAAAPEHFWRAALEGFDAPTPLALAHPAPPDAPERYREQELWLSPEITATLQNLARQNQLTISTFVQGAWGVALARYNGLEDVLFGATVSGRPPDLPGAEQMVGIFINAMPVRARPERSATVREYLQRIQAHAVEARQFEYTPLVQVQGWSEVPRDRPLFESILIFENYPVDTALKEQKSSLRIENVQSVEQTNYPITVVSGVGAALLLKIAYDGRQFDDETIGRMLGHLQTLLTGMAAGLEQTVGRLPMLTEAELAEAQAASHGPRVAYEPLAVHRLFETQAARTPDATALIAQAAGGAEALSYARLNHRANEICAALQARGVGHHALVGLYIARSAEMIAGLLGILKAGAAYLPLDPEYPPERIAFMLQDSGAQLVLTQTALAARNTLPAGLEIVTVDGDAPPVQDAQNPESGAEPDDLAYVIYTSGSTGLPKGVMITHDALANHAQALAEKLVLGPGDRMLQFITVSFDAAGEEIYPTLITGATLVLPGEARDALGAQLAQFCAEQRVTHLHMPATVWQQWADDLITGGHTPELPLKVLLLGGDTPSVERLRAWTRLLGRCVRFINAYGPTEATITASVYETTTEAPGLTRMPIGRPIANVQVSLLDAELRPVPRGAAGEIVIGGAGVARGYLNRPELTAERFVDVGGVRMYRTGDRGRWLPDGNLEFAGRVDEQVKIRGFRVEPGEIEAALRQHAHVRDAAVVAQATSDGDKRLVVYVVPADRFEVAAVRKHLAERLPDHMVPTAFVTLAALPLTPTGKLDRRGLPAPEDAEALDSAAYVAPRTPEEEIIAGILERVLRVTQVGIHDNFFDRGGHSLLATQTISRLREAFQVDLPIRALFDAPTAAGLAAAVQAARGRLDVTAPPIRRVERDGDMSLSFGQQRLWFLDQLEPGLLAYNTPVVLRLQGRLDLAALTAAIHEMVRRHEALRTTFTTRRGRPVQVIGTEWRVPVPLVDLTHLAPEAREREARRLAQDDIRQPFNLATGPVLRTTVFRLDTEDHLLAFTVHHIAADGSSLGVLVNEMAALYAAFSRGETSPLAELPLQYADYAAWQRAWLEGEAAASAGTAGQGTPLEAQVTYWKEQLAGLPPLLELPTDRPRPPVQTSNGATYLFQYGPELADQLTALSQREGVTLFMTLLAAYQTLLYRYTAQPDVAVGSVVANRPRPELEPLIGFFVNTLVFRTRFDGAPTFRQLLGQVRETALAAFAHQDAPFEMLVDALQPERNLSHTPLFQAAFSLQNFALEARELPGLKLSAVDVERGTAQFDMLLAFTRLPNGLGGSWEYNTDLFDASTIRRMAEHLETLLTAAATDPDQPVTRLPLLTPAERRRLLVEWNATDVPFPHNTTIHGLFEEQAARQPDAPAAIFARPGDGEAAAQLSYGQLNARADQLAHYLQQLGVETGALVGIATERSLEMVTGILGILKAGGAYLPLDPTYPPERLAFMLQDSGLAVVLTQARLVERLPLAESAVKHVVRLDSDWAEIAALPASKPLSTATADTLAYCIYTSGSTGRPKGTLLKHRGLCNLADVQQREFAMREGKRVLQFSPFSFDASVWETVMALRNGAALVLTPQEVLTGGELLRLLQEQRITTATLPPSLLSVLVPGELPQLETIISAGEKCTNEIVARWAPGRRFFNAYGPTETTVCASMFRAPAGEEWAWGGPPIGGPISNFQLYVVDENLQAQPTGVPGELLIGGVGLAAGYLNRPELTAERFIRNPLSAAIQMSGGALPAEPRVYRSGDKVRWLPNGALEFLGRIDDQMKVRGFRIEPGEVEAVLREHPAVQDAVVVARGDVLVGYVTLAASGNDVSEDQPQLTAGDLRAHVRGRLPEYMTPAAFVMMEAFPLSPAGKIDRRALPAPDQSHRERAQEYVAPRSPLEEQIAGICSELLGIERVGMLDNFFELGGHSLLATQLISRVRDTLGVELPLRALFENPTVEGLARQVSEWQTTSHTPLAQPPAITARAREGRRVSRASVDGGTTADRGGDGA